MSSFRITGGSTLTGSIPVYGSKNAALPLIAAGLLTDKRLTLANIPQILDVQNMLKILEGLGANVSQNSAGILSISTPDIVADEVPQDLVRSLRGSILLIGALLGRTKRASLPRPGGDIIGQRPIDAHISGFMQLGAKVTETEHTIMVDGADMQAGVVVLPELSVTATENVLLAAARLPGKTTIELAAAEPHVKALCDLLTAMGAPVEGGGTHTITISGNEHLGGATFQNIPDMLEAGLFILMGAAAGDKLTVTNVPVHDLLSFFSVLDSIGVPYEVGSRDGTADSVVVSRGSYKGFSIKALPYPGLATDLQAPFAVLATLASGSSLIHDPLYEGRFKHIQELQKMGADAVVCDPHRVIINGPTPLHGHTIPSLDIRAGATLILAGMIAEGETVIENAEIVDRGYAGLTDRLQAIGTSIERVS